MRPTSQIDDPKWSDVVHRDMRITELERELNEARARKLADRCFASAMAEDELFSAVCKVLGADVEKCLEDGFVFPCSDTYTDYYDASIEVVRKDGEIPMTKDQAGAILALGFSLIYESIGESCRYITKDRDDKCSPRPSRDESSARAQFLNTRSQLDQWRECAREIARLTRKWNKFEATEMSEALAKFDKLEKSTPGRPPPKSVDKVLP